MTKVKAEHKHFAYLVQGRVRVHQATEDSSLTFVQGSDKEPYEVHHWHGHWTCSCPARVPACAHIKAAKLILRPYVADTEASPNGGEHHD